MPPIAPHPPEVLNLNNRSQRTLKPSPSGCSSFLLSSLHVAHKPLYFTNRSLSLIPRRKMSGQRARSVNDIKKLSYKTIFDFSPGPGVGERTLQISPRDASNQKHGRVEGLGRRQPDKLNVQPETISDTLFAML